MYVRMQQNAKFRVWLMTTEYIGSGYVYELIDVLMDEDWVFKLLFLLEGNYQK